MSVTPLTLVNYRPIGTDPRSISDLIGNFDHIVNEVNNNIIPAINTVGEQAFQDFLTAGVVRQTQCTFTRDSAAQVTIATGVVWATSGGVLRRFNVSPTTLSGIPVATGQRFDVIVFDTSDGLVKRVAGTDQSGGGVTLDNRLGAPAVASTQQELWNIIVGAAGVGTVLETDYRDRRLPANPVVRGTVESDGVSTTITAGWGFRVSYTSVGKWQVKFNRGLQRDPCVVAVVEDGSLDGGRVSINASDNEGFEIEIANSADVLVDSQPVTFVAEYA